MKNPEQDRQLHNANEVDAQTSELRCKYTQLLQTIVGYTQFAQDTLAEKSRAYQDLQKALDAATEAKALTKQLFGSQDTNDNSACS